MNDVNSKTIQSRAWRACKTLILNEAEVDIHLKLVVRTIYNDNNTTTAEERGRSLVWLGKA